MNTACRPLGTGAPDARGRLERPAGRALRGERMSEYNGFALLRFIAGAACLLIAASAVVISLTS